jgi:hypothetical protein
VRPGQEFDLQLRDGHVRSRALDVSAQAERPKLLTDGGDDE